MDPPSLKREDSEDAGGASSCEVDGSLTSPRKDPGKDGSTQTSSAVEEVNALYEQRRSLEAQMEALSEFLHSPGMPGLRGRLVDEEGFPRSDIDIFAVRETRHRLACLRTDYMRVQKRLEVLLQAALAPSESSSSRLEDSSSPQGASFSRPSRADASKRREEETPPALLEDGEGPPFARVDFVFPESPSSEAGLRCGDAILRMGGIYVGPSSSSPSTARNAEAAFQKLAEEVRQHNGRKMPVVVKRDSKVKSLWVYPREWSGRGLLGCNLRPIS